MNTTRATTAEHSSAAILDLSILENQPNQPSKNGEIFSISSPSNTPHLFSTNSQPLQGYGNTNVQPFRIAIVQGSVTLTETFIERLRTHGIIPRHTGTCGEILRRLRISVADSDIVLYPITKHWSIALDFAREVRRIREQNGTIPYPKTMILSFAEQAPITIELFKRVSGTTFASFTTEKNLVQKLWLLHQQILETRRTSQRLHLRLVHAGNPSGIGCVQDEAIVATYASFEPGQEEEIKESNSVLRFLNLLAINRWRSRTPVQFVDLMQRSPLYSCFTRGATPISLSSVKTYIHRCETALWRVWCRRNQSGEVPVVIRREPCDGREVSYRLLCSCEVDHI